MNVVVLRGFSSLNKVSLNMVYFTNGEKKMEFVLIILISAVFRCSVTQSNAHCIYLLHVVKFFDSVS